LTCQQTKDRPQLLFSQNESNAQRLWDVPNQTPFVKDGINDYVIHGNQEAINIEGWGTKAAAHYVFTIAITLLTISDLKPLPFRPGSVK
jgi:hypothetical protein